MDAGTHDVLACMAVHRACSAMRCGHACGAMRCCHACMAMRSFRACVATGCASAAERRGCIVMRLKCTCATLNWAAAAVALTASAAMQADQDRLVHVARTDTPTACPLSCSAASLALDARLWHCAIHRAVAYAAPPTPCCRTARWGGGGPIACGGTVAASTPAEP
eukprot:350742-Chlamydomonas_euryale.AAC.14